MKKEFMPIITLFVGLTIAVILISGVVLPSVFSPTQPVPVTVTNSTVLNVGKSNFLAFHTFGLSSPDTTQTALFTVTYQINGSTDRAVNLTRRDGTHIASLDGTSPDIISTSQAGFATGVNTFNFTSNNTGSNVTINSLEYKQQNAQTTQGWGAGTTAMWSILSIAIVAVLLLAVLTGKT